MLGEDQRDCHRSLSLCSPARAYVYVCAHALVRVLTRVCVLVNICLLVIYRRKTGVKKSSGTSIMILSPYFKGGTNIVTQHNESSD